MSDAYKVCPKCKLRHSALVRHRCAKPKGQDEKPPKSDPIDHDLERGGDTESLDRHENESEDNGKDEGKGKGRGHAGDKGDGESDDEGEGEGEGGDDGEGEEQEGEEGNTKADGEGPAPQPPEPDAPIVQIVCTVLKFASLTAACAKNGVIEVTLNEDGIMVYGHNGDIFAFDTIPWGEFEKRSTLDGEFYVKDVIDAVDVKLLEETPKVRLRSLKPRFSRFKLASA